MAINERNEIEQLRQKWEEITAERDRLRKENHRLLRGSEPLQVNVSVSQRDLTDINTDGTPLETDAKSFAAPSNVNNESSISEKIRLFRALFRGREDVFAKLWNNRRSGKIGYSPACSREWYPTLFFSYLFCYNRYLCNSEGL